MKSVSVFLSLTCTVGIHHEALVDVVLDEQKRLLKDLSSSCLLYCVGIPRIPEKSKQLSRGTRLTGVMRDGETETERVKKGRINFIFEDMCTYTEGDVWE